MRQIPPLSYSSQGITFLRSVQYLCAFNQQVDDLQSIDALEEYIESSAVITIFVSKGYFLSKSKPLHHTQAPRSHSTNVGSRSLFCSTQTASARCTAHWRC